MTAAKPMYTIRLYAGSDGEGYYAQVDELPDLTVAGDSWTGVLDDLPPAVGFYEKVKEFQS